MLKLFLTRCVHFNTVDVIYSKFRKSCFSEYGLFCEILAICPSEILTWTKFFIFLKLYLNKKFVKCYIRCGPPYAISTLSQVGNAMKISEKSSVFGYIYIYVYVYVWMAEKFGLGRNSENSHKDYFRRKF